MNINFERSSTNLNVYSHESVVNPTGSQQKRKSKLNVLREAIIEKNMSPLKLERLINRISVSELKVKKGTEESILYLALKSGNDLAAALLFQKIATKSWSILAREVTSISKKIQLNTANKDFKLNTRIMNKFFSLDRMVYAPDIEKYLPYALAVNFAKNHVFKVIAERNCKISFNNFGFFCIIPELLGSSDIDAVKKAIIEKKLTPQQLVHS